MVCPKCGHSYVAEAERKPAKVETPKVKEAKAPAAEPEAATKEPEAAKVESEPVVSFEEADQEAVDASGSRVAALDEGEDANLSVDVEVDDSDDDSALLEDDGEFDEDVTTIIDADVKKGD